MRSLPACLGSTWRGVDLAAIKTKLSEIIETIPVQPLPKGQIARCDTVPVSCKHLKGHRHFHLLTLAWLAVALCWGAFTQQALAHELSERTGWRNPLYRPCPSAIPSRHPCASYWPPRPKQPSARPRDRATQCAPQPTAISSSGLSFHGIVLKLRRQRRSWSTASTCSTLCRRRWTIGKSARRPPGRHATFERHRHYRT